MIDNLTSFLDFRQFLPEIRESIANAAFFVIDGEFTGVSADNINPYDTPEDYYLKVNRTTQDFLLIQLGLTIFRVDESDSEKFKYKSYNFYIYPRGRKHTFKCQGQSLAFLAENGFDFNKLFKDGITFTTVEEGENLRIKMLEKHALTLPSNEVDNNESINISNYIPVSDMDNEWLSEIE